MFGSEDPKSNRICSTCNDKNKDLAYIHVYQAGVQVKEKPDGEP